MYTRGWRGTLRRLDLRTGQFHLRVSPAEAAGWRAKTEAPACCLNQFARWANTHATPIDAVEIIANLT